jgi:hypothetical protein
LGLKVAFDSLEVGQRLRVRLRARVSDDGRCDRTAPDEDMLAQ